MTCALAVFILANVEPILSEWEQFARSLAPGTAMGVIALRDHAEDILHVTARDMVSSQTDEQQTSKSKGHGGGGTESVGLDHASGEHAIARLSSGFNLIEVVSEYRALRASVLRLWARSIRTTDTHDLEDLTRFDESMDQSLTKAVRSCTNRVDESQELFLATLGHDLRNPLNAMVVSSGILARSGQLDEENTRIASQMSGFAKVMTRMIEDLLDFTRTRLGGGMPVSATRTDLRDLSRDVLDEFRAAHPHRAAALRGSRRHERRMGCRATTASRVQFGCERNPVRRRCNDRRSLRKRAAAKSSDAISVRPYAQVFAKCSRGPPTDVPGYPRMSASCWEDVRPRLY